MIRHAGAAGLALLMFFLWQGVAAGAAPFYSEDPPPATGWLDKVREKLRVSGWLEGMQSARVRRPHNAVTSRLRMRLEARADMGWLYGFASVDTEKNWKIASETGVGMHEIWLEHKENHWDLRVGRQIIIWGKADGVQVTDIISPPDYTESITRDLDSGFRGGEDA